MIQRVMSVMVEVDDLTKRKIALELVQKAGYKPLLQ